MRIKADVLQRFVASCTIKARAKMAEERQKRDFSKAPVWDRATTRWRVEIRHPDATHLRRRLRRERDAVRVWAAEQSKLEDGTWDERAARSLTVGEAIKQYRE